MNTIYVLIMVMRLSGDSVVTTQEFNNKDACADAAMFVAEASRVSPWSDPRIIVECLPKGTAS